MTFASSGHIPPITKELFDVIRLCVPKGSTILELGSGEGSTANLKEFYNVISIEHKESYIGAFNKRENYIYAPLDPHTDNQFYDMSYVEGKLPKYDALLIDGPDTEARNIWFLNKIRYFDRSVHWFFDDYCGVQLKDGIDNIIQYLGVEPFICTMGVKPFAVIMGEGK